MNRIVVLIIALIMFGLGVGAGALGITWFVGGSGEPSEPISAPTLSLDATQPVDNMAQVNDKLDSVMTQVGQQADSLAALSEQVAGLSAEISGLTSAAGDEAETSTATPVPPTTTPEPEAEAAAAESAGGRQLFRIDNELSEVRFIIDEVLQGSPKTVIGVTDQVAGDIILDFGAPASSQIGEIRINARTLATDNEFRNRALRSEILESSRDEYEFISFVPTAVTGMPDSVGIGEEVTFQVMGDLTIRNITNPVTFDVTASMVSDQRLEGTASTMVTREAYSLTIPNAPGVANVSNDVALEIDFVARPVEE